MLAINKAAGKRCEYQKFGKGCTVHGTRDMPTECRLWNCRWLANDDTADLPRPDRAHYVIDMMPDFITYENNETGEEVQIQVVQIWIDPAHPEAHRDPALRRWMARRAQEGIAVLVRLNSKDAFTIFVRDDKFHEVRSSTSMGRQHTKAEIAKALEGR